MAGIRSRTEEKKGREQEKGKEKSFQKDNDFKGREKKPEARKGAGKKRRKRSRQKVSGKAEKGSRDAGVNDKKQAYSQDKDAFRFDGDDTFAEGGDNAFSESKKLKRKQKRAEQAERKLEKARGRLPKERAYRLERVFDEKTGKGNYVLRITEKEKGTRRSAFAGRTGRKPGKAGRKLAYGSRDFAPGRGKDEEQGEENTGAEAVHMAGWQVDNTLEFFTEGRRGRRRRQHQKVSALEEKKIKADAGVHYQEYLEENPEMKKKLVRKRIQKQRIKREYAKAYRRKLAGESAGRTVTLSKDAAAGAFKRLTEAVRKKVLIGGAAGLFFLLFLLILMMFSSCGAVAGELFSMVIAGSYLSQPEEIDSAELLFTEKEMELQEEIDAVMEDYPDFDEYQYNLGEIGHNPFTLISYLSAVYTEFTAEEVRAELELLFQEMYLLEVNPVLEIRTVEAADEEGNPILDEDGNPVMEETEVRVLQVSLTVTSLEEITAGRMDGEQKEIFEAYTETKGGLQRFDSPLALYWYPYVSSYYGYRKNPFTGQRQLHRGIDIAVPENTPVYAAHDGTVAAAGFDSEYGNYVVISDGKGFTTKYAHLSAVNVVPGQEAERGMQVGSTGNTGSSTGSHLHLEVLHRNVYYNPLFYVDAGEGTLYGEAAGGGNGAEPAVPPESYEEEAVRMLIAEAEKYLGTPYRFGGYGPGGFDCSGFVSWVFTESGVCDMPRTTAQGIYDQCTPVAPGEARAGDIVFFTGTYNAGRPVTHVGIYCGNGIMVHAGDPVQYTSFAASSYWQSHFYGFGRL